MENCPVKNGNGHHAAMAQAGQGGMRPKLSEMSGAVEPRKLPIYLTYLK
jgi:hypothetical protein